MNWTEYNSTTGQMGGVHRGYQDEASALSQIFMAGMDSVVEGEYDNRTHHIISGQPIERQKQATQLSGHTLTGLPIPSTLHVAGTKHQVSDGMAELDLLMPGTYWLRVEAFPLQDWEGEVVV